MTRFALTCCGLLGLLFCSLAIHAQSEGSPNPCAIRPWQSIDNGMGAEPGVVREFASGITMPAGCKRDGRVWVPRLLVVVTRSGGSSDMPVRVSLRNTATVTEAVVPPGDDRTLPYARTLQNVPVFPLSGEYEINTGVNNNANMNAILRSETFYVSIDMDGDNTANKFLATDKMGSPDPHCFTGINGATPDDPCTTGNPTLNEAAQGAIGYTFYGRYASGAAVDGREPLGTTWGARYLAPDTEGGPYEPEGVVDLRVHESVSGNTLCTFFNIPDDFEFECVMTAPQLAMLADGDISVELTGDGPTRNTRMIPADQFIFADGFESGDTSVWSQSLPPVAQSSTLGDHFSLLDPTRRRP